MSAASVRPARPADLAAVLALLAEAELPTAGVPASLRGFVVAEDRGRVVGAVGLEPHPPDGLLRSLVVAPEARAQGLGERLSGAVVAEARAAGLARLVLLTTTAAAWFPRLGFRAVERASVQGPVTSSSEFAELCPASATVMVLEL